MAVAGVLHPAFLVALLAAIALSALYMARTLRLVFFGELSRENERVR